MINEVLHQIIDLDNLAKKIKASATARAEKIVSDTKDELKEEETNVITTAKEESKHNYDVEIRKAEEEKDNAIKEMSSSIKSLREQYESAKQESAKRVLDELFQSI